MTFALGYSLHRSRGLLTPFLEMTGIDIRGGIGPISIDLQRRDSGEESSGITDIEIKGHGFWVVVEAKKHGWPTESQLARYAHRMGDKRQMAICALGVPLECDAPTRDADAIGGVRLVHLRWHHVLSLVRRIERGVSEHENVLLSELGDLIEEVLGMQYYNREVLVRDIKFDDPSRNLYYDALMYNGGPRERSEPLFFAPNFTKDAPIGLDGIQYVSRVYYQGNFSVHDRAAAAKALEAATCFIGSRVEALQGRKTSGDSIAYLKTLPAKWKKGISRMPEIWPDDEQSVAILFLGEPMRLPLPLRKEGGMVPPGFSLTLEELLSHGGKSFRC